MKQTKSKKKLAAIAMLLVITLIGGSLAYWSQELSVENQFNTGEYGSELFEDITRCEEKDWEPGTSVKKEVMVTNTGDYDVIVRAKLDEAWVREGATIKEIVYNDKANVNHSAAANEYAIIDVYQEAPNDGFIQNDNTVVQKNFKRNSDWILSEEDGWYYYIGNLTPGSSTDLLIKSLTLDKDTDMGVYYETYLCTTGGDWYEYDPDYGIPKYLDSSGTPVEEDAPGAEPVTQVKTQTTLDKDHAGYSNADYKLTITTQTIQASRDALIREWFGDSASTLNDRVDEVGADWDLH